MSQKSFQRAAASALLLGLGLVCSWTDPARADEPVREVRHDPNAFPAPSTRLPTVGVGFAMTAVWYGFAVGGSYLFPTARGADELRIPIAGPWMSLLQTGCPETTPDCSKFWMVVGAVLKGLDGVGQAGGLLVIAEGLLMPTVEQKQSARLWSDRPGPRTASTSLLVLPTALPGGAGIGVAGLF